MNTEQTNSGKTPKYGYFLSRWGPAVAIAGLTIGVLGMYLVLTEQRSRARSYEFYEFEYRTTYRRFLEDIRFLEERVDDLELEVEDLRNAIGRLRELDSVSPPGTSR